MNKIPIDKIGLPKIIDTRQNRTTFNHSKERWQIVKLCHTVIKYFLSQSALGFCYTARILLNSKDSIEAIYKMQNTYAIQGLFKIEN